MKTINKVLTILTLSLGLLSPLKISAQEKSTLSTTTQYFDLELVRDSQSPWNKGITYIIYVTPKIDSKRTQILWDAPTSIVIKPKHNDFQDLYRENTYSFKAQIFPSQSGNYQISVNLIAWQHDTNYTNSVSDIVTINSDLLAVPVDTAYTYGLIAKYLIITLVVGIGIWMFLFLGKKGIKSLKKWLTPPN